MLRGFVMLTAMFLSFMVNAQDYVPSDANGIRFSYLEYEEKIKRAPKISPKKQQTRPGYFKGVLLIGDQKFNFGTGSERTANRNMRRGSIPYGVHEIRPGLWKHGRKKRFRNDSFYIEDSFDPKWNTKRTGILIHKASNKNMRSAGCIVIHPKEWKRFKTYLLKFQETVDNRLILKVNPDGTALIVPKKVYEHATRKHEWFHAGIV